MSDKKNNPDNTQLANQPAAWSWYKKLGFRIIFVFLLAMCIPFTSSWYKNVCTLDWLHPHYRDIYDIARFQPSFRQFFGGRGDYDDGDFGGAADNTAAGAKNKHKHGAAGTINGSDSTADSSGGDANRLGKHHHHHGDVSTEDGASSSEGHNHKHNIDSALTGNQEPGKHHHHREFTGVAAIGDTLHGSQAHLRHHHHHYNDSTSNAVQGPLAAKTIGNDHPDTLSWKTISKNDSTQVASTKATIEHKGDKQQALANASLPPKKSFLADYSDWGISFLIGVVGGLIWTLFDRKSKSYNFLYYWIRVVVRYRAGIGIIGFGFTKLFPTQMPFPSLGLLNSNFGDFTAQKIYWMSVGIVPWYQVFGGVVEIAAGTMLFFRKTTTFGAILLAGALGDITYVNYAYDGGVHVYAFYFVFLALFLIADDVPKLYNLLILERYTVPLRYYPDFRKAWLKYSRIGLKVLVFVIFFVILTYTEVINFKYDPYKQPSTAGLKQLRGNYHVTEFKLNGREIPYSPLDSVRWQQATFENWTTLTFKVNRPVIIDPSNGGGSPMKDIQRTFEITGVAGGERAFHYYADTVDKVLYLEDKNVMALRGKRGGGKGKHATNKQHPDNWISATAWQHIGSEKNMIDPHAWSTRRDREFAVQTPEPKRSRMVLKYSTTDGSRVILSGINESRDSIYVVLDRYDKKYTLPGSTLSAGKY
jgi:hypothetical protein